MAGEAKNKRNYVVLERHMAASASSVTDRWIELGTFSAANREKAVEAAITGESGPGSEGRKFVAVTEADWAVVTLSIKTETKVSFRYEQARKKRARKPVAVPSP